MKRNTISIKVVHFRGSYSTLVRWASKKANVSNQISGNYDIEFLDKLYARREKFTAAPDPQLNQTLQHL